MHSRLLTTGSLFMLGGVIAIAGGTAHADIKYTSETRMAMAQAGASNKPMTVVTTAVMKGAQRTETAQNVGPVQMNTVELTLCDKRQKIKLDTAQKIYTVTPFDEKAGEAATTTATNAAAGAADNGGGAPGTGKIITTSSVKDLGEETIADVKTRRYLITSRMQMSGCAGNSDISTKMEVWVGPNLTTEMNCDIGSTDPAVAMARARPNCNVSFEHRGDTEAYTKVYTGIIMRTKMYQGDTDKVMMSTEVTGLSRAKLDESLFAVPAGFKQVSEEEFQKAQQQAMMQAMLKNVPGAGGAGGNAGANADPAADDNGDGANNEGKTEGDKAEGDNNENKENDKKEEQPQEQPQKKKKKLPFKLPF